MCCKIPLTERENFKWMVKRILFYTPLPVFVRKRNLYCWQLLLCHHLKLIQHEQRYKGPVTHVLNVKLGDWPHSTGLWSILEGDMLGCYRTCELRASGSCHTCGRHNIYLLCGSCNSRSVFSSRGRSSVALREKIDKVRTEHWDLTASFRYVMCEFVSLLENKIILLKYCFHLKHSPLTPLLNQSLNV